MPVAIRGKPPPATPARCGGLLSSTAAAWDLSTGSVVVASGRHVRLHRVLDASGGVTRTKSRTLAVHERDVVAVAVLGPMRALSASQDGILQISDTDDSVCLRTIDLGEPVYDVVATRWEETDCEGQVFVACKHHAFAMPAHNPGRGSRRLLLWQTSVNSLACDSTGRYVVAISEKNLFLACKPLDESASGSLLGGKRASSSSDKGRSQRRKRDFVRGTISLPSTATAVAISSDGSIVAMGDNTGCIHVYKDVWRTLQANRTSEEHSRDERLQGIVPAKFHWHSGPVLALEFAADGGVLLSGGTEAVLVSWKMTRSDFGDRSFRPRIGGAIWGIAPSPNDRYYAATCADNAVRILDALSLGILTELQGLAVPVPPTRQVTRKQVLHRIKRLSFDPDPALDGSVLVSGAGGAVQIFDVYRGEHVGFFQVVPRNQIHAGGVVGDSKQPINPVVRQCQMSNSGDSLATIDVQQSYTVGAPHEDSAGREMEILRFWHRSPDSKSLDMVARVESPHGLSGHVTALRYHPSLPVLATASSCGSVKMWRLVDTGVESRKYTWRCEAEHKHRSLACQALSFSEDGSMLAVAAGSTIALLHVNFVELDDDESASASEAGGDGSVLESAPSSVSLEALHSFVHPPADELVKDVSFVKGDIPALASITKHGVYVWNVLTKCIWWSLRMVISGSKLSVDPMSSRFAIVVSLPHTNATEVKISRRKSVDIGVVASGLPRGLGSIHGSQSVESGTCVDHGLVVFNSMSPVPLFVRRLPQFGRVLEHSFVPVPLKKSSSGDLLSPLVYIDGDMEIHVVSHTGVDSGASFTSGGMEVSEVIGLNRGEPENRLDALIGAQWRQLSNQEKNKDSTGDAVGVVSDVSSVVSKAFALETHLLGPVIDTAPAIITQLLNTTALPNYGFNFPGCDGPIISDGESEAPVHQETSVPSSLANVKADAESPWASGRGRRKRIAKFTAFFEKHAVS